MARSRRRTAVIGVVAVLVLLPSLVVVNAATSAPQVGASGSNSYYTTDVATSSPVIHFGLSETSFQNPGSTDGNCPDFWPVWGAIEFLDKVDGRYWGGMCGATGTARPTDWNSPYPSDSQQPQAVLSSTGTAGPAQQQATYLSAMHCLGAASQTCNVDQNGQTAATGDGSWAMNMWQWIAVNNSCTGGCTDPIAVWGSHYPNSGACGNCAPVFGIWTDDNYAHLCFGEATNDHYGGGVGSNYLCPADTNPASNWQMITLYYDAPTGQLELFTDGLLRGKFSFSLADFSGGLAVANGGANVGNTGIVTLSGNSSPQISLSVWSLSEWIGSAADNVAGNCGAGNSLCPTGSGSACNQTTNNACTYLAYLYDATGTGETLQQEPLQGGPITPAEDPTGNFCRSCMVRAHDEATVGDPVNTAYGNLTESATDISLPGRGIPLQVSRSYSSSNAATNGPFGYGWHANLVMSLSQPGGTGPVTITQEGGAQTVFNPSGSSYAPAAPRDIATLAHNGNGTWTMTRMAADTLTFSSSGQLVSDADRNGYTTAFGYTGSQLTSMTDPAGRQLAFGWTGSNITSVTDANVTPSRAVSYQYDAAGELTDVLDVNGGHTHFAYDASHRLTNVYDPNCYAAGTACNAGSGVVNHYTSGGQVDWQQDQLGRKTFFAYTGDPSSAAGGTTTITDPIGNVVTDTYQYGVLTSQTKGTGTTSAATSSYTYDPTSAALAAVTDPNGHTTRYFRDASGNQIGEIDPLGRYTSATYNGFNEPLTQTDALGVTTTSIYDTHGNLTSVSMPLVGSNQTKSTTYTYGDSNHPGDVTVMTDPDTKTWHYTYDAYGDRATVADPLTDTSTICYNNDGWKIASYTPKAGTITCANPPPSSTYETKYSYVQPNGQTDEFGDVQTVTDQLTHTTKSTYDADRNVLSSTDGDGNLTKYTFDLANEQTDVVRADQSTLHTDYNLDGTVHDQKDGKTNAIQTYGYDSLARVTSVTDALTTIVSRYAYDGAGNQLTKQDPGGNCSATPATGCTTMAYDADNELISEMYSDGVTPNVTSITYDSDGQRTGMTDGTGTSNWVWDSLHRLKSYTDGNGDQVLYQYNLRGLVTQLTYPGALNVTNGYDEASHLKTVQDWLGNTTTFAYDANSNETTETLPASTNFKDTFTYDAADNVNLIADAQGSNAPSGFLYTRDNNNQLASTVTAGVTQPNESYAYSPLNQLKTVNSGTYTYDAADNITGLTSGASLSYNAADQITTMTQGGVSTAAAYDLKGELTSIVTPSGSSSTTAFGYDQAGRLTSYAPPQWTSVVTGYYHTLALRADGTVWSWGDNSHGELGNGTTTSSTTSQLVSSLSGVTAIAAGGYHSLALKSDGTVWTWGDNLDGDLGNGSTTQSNVPVQVQGLSGVVAIAAGQSHSLALKSGGTMVAWGNNRSGQLGDPNISLQSTTPVPVSGLTGVSAIAGGDIHSLAASSGSVWAWGDNSDGQLGSGQTQANGYTPVQVPGVSNATAVAGGGRFSMARESDGSVWAWGYNADGELGNGTTTTSSTATKVTGIPAVSSIAAGYFQGLALDSTEPPGTSNVWAWGGNSQGALGNGTTQSSATPVHVQGTGGVQSIAGGGLHTEAIGNAQTTWGWGRDYEGELGDGDLDSTTTPVMLGTNATYAYNGVGLRMSKTTPLNTAHYTWDVSVATPPLLSDGSMRYLYGPGGLPLEQIDASNHVTYLHHDELGSTRLLTDASGNITGTYSYDAYGNLSGRTGTATTNLLYAGQYRDSDSNLYYMHARYYDPSIAQFLSRDPAVATTRSPYGYAYDNPVNLGDPTGLGSCPNGVAIPFTDLCVYNPLVNNQFNANADLLDNTKYQLGPVTVSPGDVLGALPIFALPVAATRASEAARGEGSWLSVPLQAVGAVGPGWSAAAGTAARRLGFDGLAGLLSRGAQLTWSNALGGGSFGELLNGLTHTSLPGSALSWVQSQLCNIESHPTIADAP